MVRREDLGGVSSLAPVPPDGIVRYAAHPDGLVDVHLPPLLRSRPARLLVLLHGGFWKAAYDRVHTRAAAAALAAEGFVVATPEYRRVGARGGWPVTAQDVAAAVASAPALLTGLGIVTHGTTVVGHSAGGHLALWLAGEDLPLDRVVGLAPVADLRAAARDRLGGGATQAFLGGEPDEVPETYDAADPAARLARRPSCRIVVVHGTDDTEVPLAHSEQVAGQHPFIELHAVAGADHFALIDPTSPAWPAVLAAL